MEFESHRDIKVCHDETPTVERFCFPWVMPIPLAKKYRAALDSSNPAKSVDY